MESNQVEIHDRGFTRVKNVGATMSDFTAEKFVEFKEETKEKFKKLNDDIKGIKMQLGRMSRNPRKNIDDVNITEGVDI